jgi:pimeloyl-ACP methyl ester carboxylesterase
MLDPPLLTGLTAFLFRFLKNTPIIDRLTPAGKSKVRNRRWLSSDPLVDYFEAKPLFKGITRSVIQDYVESGTFQKAGYQHLVFHPEVETALFRNIPHNLHQYKGKLACPALLLTAEHTHICKPYLINPFLKMNPHIEHETYQGVGHLFPFQQPEHTAIYIRNFIQKHN